jgi:hypothetical protein
MSATNPSNVGPHARKRRPRRAETRRRVLRTAGAVGAAAAAGVTLPALAAPTAAPTMPAAPVNTAAAAVAAVAQRSPGSSRFDRFTERAKKVLVLAQQEAQRFNHNYIGTEHLLLGLTREGQGMGGRTLSSLGVQSDRVREKVEFIIGRGDTPVTGDISLTPRAKKAIALAVDEAQRMGHTYIGTEHVLLGLVHEGEGIAAGVLTQLDVDLDSVRARTLELLETATHDQRATPAPPTPGAPTA